MDLGNGMDFIIKKVYYNRTKLQPDGITQVVDTDTQYPLYQLRISKNYFDTESESEIIDNVIRDLEGSVIALKKLREKEKIDRRKNYENEK